MTRRPHVPEVATLAGFFRGQALHALFLVALLPATWALASASLRPETTPWFVAAVLEAVLHQVVVWVGWRTQLGFRAWTRVFGDADLLAWCAVFFPLLLARPALLIALAWVDRGTLALPAAVAVPLGLALLIPAIATQLSVRTTFGMVRAAGSDHFRLEDRDRPLVREGMFRFTPNAMYVFAFLGLWSVALLAGSQLALIVALFQHAYIQIHWVATEQPDLELLHR